MQHDHDDGEVELSDESINLWYFAMNRFYMNVRFSVFEC